MYKVLFYRRNYHDTPDTIKEGRIGFFGMTFVYEGSLTYIINKTEYTVKSGDAVFLPKSCMRNRLPVGNSAHYVSITFLTDESIGLPTVIHGGASQKLWHLFAVADELKSGGCQYNDIRFSLICEYIVKELEATLSQKREKPLVTKIKEYIGKNVCRSISLREVGEAMYFSPNYCQAVFKKETGQTIIDYSLQKRINYARELMLETNAPLKEIAEKAGFGDYNYFARTFRKVTGFTPTQVKKLGADF